MSRAIISSEQQVYIVNSGIQGIVTQYGERRDGRTDMDGRFHFSSVNT
jgi:hypothetical protein